MSSFRPEIETPAPVFVPQALGVGRVTGASGLVFSAADAVGEPETDAESEAGDAEAAVPDPEALAAIVALETEAFERGREAGLGEARALDAAVQAIEDAAARLAVAATGDVAANRGALLGLAGEIARRWVGAELATSPEAFEGLLARALERLGDAATATIRLGRADLERLDAARPGWRLALGAPGAIDFAADDALGAGEFAIDAEASSIEGRTTAILADLMDQLAPAIAADTPEPERVNAADMLESAKAPDAPESANAAGAPESVPAGDEASEAVPAPDPVDDGEDA